MSSPTTTPILLIEDDPDMRDLVAGLLDDYASVLVVARSAHEGLARLQATTENMVVVTSGVLRDMSASDLLEVVVRDGGLARRHAFVVVTPEERVMQVVAGWQTRVPLFTVLEPYGRDELLGAVARAAQCAELSHALSGGLLGTRAYGGAGGTRAALPDAGEGGHGRGLVPSTAAAQADRLSEPGMALGIVVVGGEPGIRRLVSHTLAYGHFTVLHAPDHAVALAWLRACQEAMVVVLNGTRTEQHFDLLLAVVNEASLVRHTYLLLLPTGTWLMPWQRDLLGLLNIPVVGKPFSPIAFRRDMLALASPVAPEATPSR